MKRTLTLNKAKYADAADSSQLQKLLRQQLLSIFSWQDSPGTTYSEHSHDHDEVIVVYSGAIKFTIAGKDYLLEAGDELILPAGTRHSAVNPGSEMVRYFICS